MIKYENHCCNCAVPGYPCMGNSCPYINVPVYYCDMCTSSTYADYEIDGSHYCEEHAEKYLKERCEELNIFEMADILGIDLHSL